MTIKHIEISEQFRQVYFYLNVKEVDDLFASIDEDTIEMNNLDGVKSKKNFEEEKLKIAIEIFLYDLLDEELIDDDIFSIGKKELHQLLPLTKGKPFMGSVKFAVLPDNINFALPSVIPNSVVQVVTEEDVLDSIERILDENKYFHYVETDIVSERCKVIYDLRYTKLGKIINEIPDLELYTDQDDDTDLAKFMNCKVDDIVILGSNEVITEAKIKRIEKKEIDELTNNIVEDIDEFETYDIISFKRKIREILNFKNALFGYIYFILEFALQQSKLEIEQEVLDLYINDKNNLIDDEEKINQAKHELFLDYIVRIVELRTNEELIDDVYYNKLYQQLDYFYLINGDNIDNFEDDLLEKMSKRLKVLLYCQRNNIIKNIKL